MDRVSSYITLKIRLRAKKLSATNTLAYLFFMFMTNKKYFIALTTAGSEAIRLFTDIIYERS